MRTTRWIRNYHLQVLECRAREAAVSGDPRILVPTGRPRLLKVNDYTRLSDEDD